MKKAKIVFSENGVITPDDDLYVNSRGSVVRVYEADNEYGDLQTYVQHEPDIVGSFVVTE